VPLVQLEPSALGALYRSHVAQSPRAASQCAALGDIHPCRPIVAKRPPKGPTWVHELKHDGYRLQIHIRDGRVRLFTMRGHDWTDRYPLIVEDAARLNVSAIMDAEVVCTDGKGVPDFDRLHSRTNDHLAFACAFDLLMVGGADLR
jgi:bifunctional non-homologous end joining protein LigD